MEFSLPLVQNLHFVKEEMSSPLSDQILNFCESEFFPNVQNSEVASSSNCCSYEEQSSYSNNLDMNKFSNTIEKNEEKNITTVTSNVIIPSRINDDNNNNNNMNNNDLSIMFDTQEDQIENDISASIQFTQAGNFSIPHHLLHTQHQDLFDINSLNDQHMKMTDHVSDGSLHQQYHHDHHHHHQPPIVPLMGPSLGHYYEDDSLSSIPSYMRVPTSSSSPLLDPSLANYLPLNTNTNLPNAECSAILAAAAAAATPGGSLFFGTEFPPVQEMDFQGDSSRLFCPDSLPRVYNCTSDELQALSNESQHLVSTNPLASEITNLEDTTYKAVKCTPEERREKIHRYMKKRNERNFSKKIKYACRKTLADSRPRVRGRFAKNDEFGEASAKTMSCGTNEDITHDHQDVKLNFTYHQDPNMMNTSSGHDNNGRIFTSNCHSSTSPYDICPPLYCTDGQLH
ncbi:uncharacterized protein LOC125862977 [Solanum stenotomum]|uniref:uncharacterized protein LOC125862977 n=1 Tax=Solanum stenotomum TaxID=172797 RepID=UPI0020D15B14|nr:uncharacterized protein LOC125862977 [Solanum stenotomum]